MIDESMNVVINIVHQGDEIFCWQDVAKTCRQMLKGGLGGAVVLKLAARRKAEAVMLGAEILDLENAEWPPQNGTGLKNHCCIASQRGFPLIPFMHAASCLTQGKHREANMILVRHTREQHLPPVTGEFASIAYMISRLNPDITPPELAFIASHFGVMTKSPSPQPT